MAQRPVAPGGPDEATDRGGLRLALVILGAAAVAASVGLAPLVAYAVPLAVAGAAVALAGRRSTAYVEFLLWVWLLTPGLRRIVDLHAGWDPLSPVMLAAPLASLAALPTILRGRRRVHRDAQIAFLVTLLALAYGVLVGVVRTSSVAAPLAALLTWAPPIVSGLYVATVGPSRDAMAKLLTRFAVGAALAVGGYALVQWFGLPAWDRYWMEHAPMASIGRPEPMEVRVFSTLNSPGPFASVIAALLVVLLGTRSRLRLPAAVLAVVGLGLSLVRSAWLGLAVALLAVVSGRQSRSLRRTLLLVAVPAVALLMTGGPVSEAVNERISASVEKGDEDLSLLERADLYAELGPVVVRDLVGQGLGTTGVSTKAGNDGDLGEHGDLDSGLLEYLFVFGLPVGLAALVATTVAAVGAWRRGRRGSELDKACAAAALGIFVQLPFGNALVSVSGLFFWLLLGALSSRDDDPAPGAPALGAHPALDVPSEPKEAVPA
jgi:hypothetical protein